ncbi:MAG: heme exporter protein CcmB [Terriglobales bacterium]
MASPPASSAATAAVALPAAPPTGGLSVPTAPLGSPSAWGVFAATWRRDLRIEWRDRQALNAMLFYALLVIVIFSFAFEAQAALTVRVGGGLLWVAFLFAGLLALDRAFGREAAGDCLTGLAISPASRAATLAGKCAAAFVLMLAIEAILVPLFAVLFNAPAVARWGGIALTVVLGTWALAATGTYFSALGAHSRQRTLLLPLLLLPVAIPAVIAMVQATQLYLNGRGDTGFWLQLLVAYDAIFTALGVLLADVVLEVE